MTSSSQIARTFAEPQQWGLRGDPFLWKELREHFLKTALPDTSEEFVQLVESKIEDLIGSDLRSDQPIFVERYDAGGMSSGHISPEWWLTKGVPLLKKQFASDQVVSDEEARLE